VEQIKEALQNLSRDRNTLHHKSIEPDPELTLEEKREELRKSLGVSSLDNTFEVLKPWPGTEKALAAFKALASGKTEWKMLLCYGGVGNGKTHFCEATALTLYGRGLFCRVLTLDRIMGALKECMGPDQQNSLEELISNYRYADRLIIDDVAGTEWEFEQLEKIIRARYREHLFTILTSNLNIEPDPDYPKIPFIPERIVSRFRDPEKGRLVLNQGEDYRPHKGEK